MVAHVEHLRRNPQCSLSGAVSTNASTRTSMFVGGAIPSIAERESSKFKVDIHDLYGHLARFCGALWKRRQQAPAPSDLASLISALQRQKLVPSFEAGMMHTVRTTRNSHVHDHRRLGPRETQILNGAWDVINEWAAHEHATLWKSTAGLP